MSATTTTTKRVSHLIHVDSIPEDAIPIKQYGSHSFTNLFYSPHSKSLYQQYKKRIREIPSGNDEHGKARRIYVRTSDGKTIYISMKKIEKIIVDSGYGLRENYPIAITGADDGDNIVISEEEDESESNDDANDEAESNADTTDATDAKTTTPEGTRSAKTTATKKRKEKKGMEKIRYVKGKNAQSQVGVIGNAAESLKEAKATKHRQSKKITVKPSDVIM